MGIKKNLLLGKKRLHSFFPTGKIQVSKKWNRRLGLFCFLTFNKLIDPVTERRSGEFNSQVRHLSPLRREAEVYPIGCLKAQTFSWPGVEAVLNQGDLILCDLGKRHFLREVLPDQAVGIFV